MTRTRFAGAAAMLVLAVGLAGCSDSGGDGGDEGRSDGGQGASGSQAVRAAYRKTAAADTAKAAVVTKATADGKTVAVRGSGVMNLAKGDSRMTLTSQGQEMEQRVHDGVVFQKPPAEQRAGLPTGKTWMSVDLAKLNRSGSGGGGQVSDPAESFAYTKAVRDGEVTKKGTDTVDGVRTTHYRVEVDVRTLAGGDESEADRLREQLGTSSLPLDLWLDDEGRLRQETVRLTVRQAGSGQQKTQQVTTATTLRFSDFGTEADVEAPPAENTVDVTDKLARSAGGDQGAAS
ncbi:hypothetical protein ACFV6E_41585 [Streptomyces sp. NPDC059785]|uniref:hypothetical protein n=1 Tax=unclassified Streptomyces TaxID=2593676 RepID=UPI003649C81A